MVSLLGQTVAVVAATYLLRALLSRAGMQFGLPRATALAVLLTLSIVSVASLRESWHALDVQRAQTANLSPVSARAECEKVAIDTSALGWVASRIPNRGRYYVQIPYNPLHTGEICMRFVLLPRLQVRHLSQARYVVFWRSRPLSTIAELRRRGAVVETHGSMYAVARLP